MKRESEVRRQPRLTSDALRLSSYSSTSTPVAIIRSNEERARELLEVEGFQEDLRTMKSDGRPLWSGKAESLKLRPAKA